MTPPTRRRKITGGAPRKKGRLPGPSPGVNFGSVILGTSQEYSKKPEYPRDAPREAIVNSLISQALRRLRAVLRDACSRCLCEPNYGPNRVAHEAFAPMRLRPRKPFDHHVENPRIAIIQQQSSGKWPNGPHMRRRGSARGVMRNFIPPPRDIVAYGNTLGCPQDDRTGTGPDKSAWLSRCGAFGFWAPPPSAPYGPLPMRTRARARA